MKRDSDLATQDSASIVLDSFLDRRAAYDLFLARNSGCVSPLQGGVSNPQTPANQVVLKLRWTFRR